MQKKKGKLWESIHIHKNNAYNHPMKAKTLTEVKSRI